ncbi:hypothetical protein Bpfe_021424 [Biomphalaria pfeifferi]|uniref:Transmembrane protein n=1 Tax=Biomphalaria pfeifferi TaxID=112525 RepID=A0AAD8F2R7_BIOPF|nr:hypothetical protein Bpfe_021424 [Biomphalaria pfeifferi]
MGTHHDNHFQPSSHTLISETDTCLETHDIHDVTVEAKTKDISGRLLSLLYIASCIVGLVLLSVGVYLTVLGYVDSEMDYVIIGSSGIYAGLCFNFVFVYQIFKKLNNKFRKKEIYEPNKHTSVKAAPSILQQERGETIPEVLQSKYAYNRGILKSNYCSECQNSKTVYFRADIEEEGKETKVILLNQAKLKDHCNGYGDGTQLGSERRNKLNKQNQKLNIDGLIDHKQGKSIANKNNSVKRVTKSSLATQQDNNQKQNFSQTTQQGHVTHQIHKRIKCETRPKENYQACNVLISEQEKLSNQTSSPLIQPSPDVQVSKDSSLTRVKRKAQLKVVIETHSTTGNNFNSLITTAMPKGTEVPRQHVQTVEACVHTLRTTNNCDSGKASIDSLSMLDENDNVFLKGCSGNISPSKDVSDDFQFSMSDSISLDFRHQTDKKMAFLDVSKYSDTSSIEGREHRLPSIDVGEHRLPSIDVGEHRLPSIDVGEHRLVFIDVSNLRLLSNDLGRHILSPGDLGKFLKSASDVTKHKSPGDVDKHAGLFPNHNVTQHKLPSSDRTLTSNATKNNYSYGFMTIDDHIEVLSD